MTIGITRRDLLKRAGALGVAVTAEILSPPWTSAFSRSPQSGTSTDALTVRRSQMAATPIEVTKLTNLLTLFSGPGGNVVVRNGEEGKVVVDTFVQGAFMGLKHHLDAMGPAPIVLVINTHWHFDHSDNNESFRKAGAEVVAHEKTKRRLSETHDLLGMHFSPAPAAAMPTKTFVQTHEVKFDLPGAEEYIDLGYIPPAHTDTDIYVRFVMGDVLHLGDTFFNGTYPFIDVSTGGTINGMIAAADRALKVANPGTRIVPGHGPVADRATLMEYRDMLVTVRDRVQKLKAAGRTESDVVAAKPTADLDATWGQGFTQPDAFVSIVYSTV